MYQCRTWDRSGSLHRSGSRHRQRLNRKWDPVRIVDQERYKWHHHGNGSPKERHLPSRYCDHRSGHRHRCPSGSTDERQRCWNRREASTIAGRRVNIRANGVPLCPFNPTKPGGGSLFRPEPLKAAEPEDWEPTQQQQRKKRTTESTASDCIFPKIVLL